MRRMIRCRTICKREERIGCLSGAVIVPDIPGSVILLTVRGITQKEVVPVKYISGKTDMPVFSGSIQRGKRFDQRFSFSFSVLENPAAISPKTWDNGVQYHRQAKVAVCLYSVRIQSGMPLSIRELPGRKLTDEELDMLALECSCGKIRTIGAFKVGPGGQGKIYQTAG